MREMKRSGDDMRWREAAMNRVILIDWMNGVIQTYGLSLTPVQQGSMSGTYVHQFLLSFFVEHL